MNRYYDQFTFGPHCPKCGTSNIVSSHQLKWTPRAHSVNYTWVFSAPVYKKTEEGHIYDCRCEACGESVLSQKERLFYAQEILLREERVPAYVMDNCFKP